MIEQQLSEQRERTERQQAQRDLQLASRLSRISTPTVDEQIRERKESRRRQVEEAERQREAERMRGKERMSWVSLEDVTEREDVVSSNVLIIRMLK